MPSTIQIAEFVFGAVLILLALTGGNFELFGSKIAAINSNKFLRFTSLCLGGFMLTLSLYGNPLQLFAKPYISTLEFIDYHASGGSNDLWSGFVSLDDCSKKCLEDQNCKGFTYSKRQAKCFLKDSLGKQIQNGDTYSGIKKYR